MKSIQYLLPAFFSFFLLTEKIFGDEFIDHLYPHLLPEESAGLCVLPNTDRAESCVGGTVRSCYEYWMQERINQENPDCPPEVRKACEKVCPSSIVTEVYPYKVDHSLE